MRLQEIMLVNVVQISPCDSIVEASNRMRERAIGCLVVTSDSALKGIITDRDLLTCIDQRHDPRGCQVAHHMSRPVIVLPPEEDLLTAVSVMYKNRVKRIPVVKDGKLLGIVSLSDLAAVAEAEREKVEAATVFIGHLIKAQAAQRGRLGPQESQERALAACSGQTGAERETFHSAQITSAA